MNYLRIWSVTSWNVILIMCLGVAAIVGDRTVSRCNSNLSRAVADSCTHSLIGLLTWLVVSLNYKNYSSINFYEIFACGFLSSLIDIDHFIAAKSMKLKDAVNLSSRPFLHCSTLLLSTSVSFLIICSVLNFKEFSTLGWILLAAFLSHHIRDATRHGLWIWPFGSTPPIPYNAYILLTMFLPIVLILAMLFFSTSPKPVYNDVVEV